MAPDNPFGPPIQRPAAAPIRIEKQEEDTGPAEPLVVPVWAGRALGAVGDTEADKPTLTLYPPPRELATGTTVIICPGGGYTHLALDHEGVDVAEWLNALGVTAVLLRYRVAPRYRQPAPLQDARRAVRLVRYRAEEWKLDPHRIGLLGFSAGGHLAAITGARWNEGNRGAEDPVDRVTSRPDFMVLAYPVITLAGKYSNDNVRGNLLGEDAKERLIQLLSCERHVNTGTPPTFLVHANDDKTVLPENSLLFYLALRKAGVPAEVHIYERGGHGFGLAPDDPVLSSWPRRCADWLRRRGLIEKQA